MSTLILIGATIVGWEALKRVVRRKFAKSKQLEAPRTER